MAGTNSIPRVLLKILNLLIFSSRIGKGKGEGEGEVEERRCWVAQLFVFAPKCHGNAESDIDCKYGNAISTLLFVGNFPVKLKLPFFSRRARKAEKKNRWSSPMPRKCRIRLRLQIWKCYFNFVCFLHFPVKLKLLFFSRRARKAEKTNRWSFPQRSSDCPPCQGW